MDNIVLLSDILGLSSTIDLSDQNIQRSVPSLDDSEFDFSDFAIIALGEDLEA